MDGFSSIIGIIILIIDTLYDFLLFLFYFLRIFSTLQTPSALAPIRSMQRYRAEYSVRFPYADGLAMVVICFLRSYHGKQILFAEGTV